MSSHFPVDYVIVCCVHVNLRLYCIPSVHLRFAPLAS